MSWLLACPDVVFALWLSSADCVGREAELRVALIYNHSCMDVLTLPPPDTQPFPLHPCTVVRALCGEPLWGSSRKVGARRVTVVPGVGAGVTLHVRPPSRKDDAASSGFTLLLSLSACPLS